MEGGRGRLKNCSIRDIKFKTIGEYDKMGTNFGYRGTPPPTVTKLALAEHHALRQSGDPLDNRVGDKADDDKGMPPGAYTIPQTPAEDEQLNVLLRRGKVTL